MRGSALPSHASVAISPTVASPTVNAAFSGSTSGANTTRAKFTRNTIELSETKRLRRDTEYSFRGVDSKVPNPVISAMGWRGQEDRTSTPGSERAQWSISARAEGQEFSTLCRVG